MLKAHLAIFLRVGLTYKKTIHSVRFTLILSLAL